MKNTYQPTPSASRRAFTIAELVVGFLIISVLVLIMAPTLANRAADAKVAAARSDMQHLADAQERASIDTGYFYRIYVLDDGIQGDGIAATDPDDQREGIRDNEIDSTENIYDDPEKIFISMSLQDYAPNNADLLQRLTLNETNFGWRGPYVNWHRDANENDWPDDPWGNDYLFFTWSGVIYPPIPNADDADLETDTSFEFQAEGPPYQVSQAAGGAVERAFGASGRFDRPTFLSLGPNGLPGAGTNDPDDEYGDGDDLVFAFGGN